MPGRPEDAGAGQVAEVAAADTQVGGGLSGGPQLPAPGGVSDGGGVGERFQRPPVIQGVVLAVAGDGQQAAAGQFPGPSAVTTRPSRPDSTSAARTAPTSGTGPAAARIVSIPASAVSATVADQRPRGRSGPGISPSSRARSSCQRARPR